MSLYPFERTEILSSLRSLTWPWSAPLSAEGWARCRCGDHWEECVPEVQALIDQVRAEREGA